MNSTKSSFMILTDSRDINYDLYPYPITWEKWPIFYWVIMSPLRCFLLSIFAFAWYFIAQNIIACYFGVGLSRETSELVFKHINFSFIQFSAVKSVGIPAFEDFIHFVFASITLFFGINLGGLILRIAPAIIPITASDSGLSISPEDYEQCIRILSRKFKSIILLLFPFLGFVLTFISFIILENHPELINWWAHSTYGPSGIILAVNISLVIAGGILYGEILIIYLITYYKLFQYPIKLKPYHPDGNGGFQPFGILSILIYILLILGGLCFITIYLNGYFGLEKAPIFWISVLFYLCVVFLVVFAPVIWFSVRINHEKRKELKRLEILLNTITEDTINENAEIKEVPPLQDLSILFEAYNNHPITPLGRSTFTAMLGSYSMQVVGGIYGFF